MIKIIKGFVFCSFFVLAACSGGGEDVNTKYSVSGTIRVVNNIATDSDNNDIFSPYADNSDLENPQILRTLTTLNGFVTASFTEGGRFTEFALPNKDPVDVFLVPLIEGQVIRMEIIDHDNESPVSNNLDLFLVNATTDQLVSSISTTNIEEVQVPESGDYYLQVEAISGASKYVLQLDRQLSNNSVLHNRNINTEDMMVGEAIVSSRTDLNVASSFSLLDEQKSVKTALLEFEVFTNVISAFSSGKNNWNNVDQQWMERDEHVAKKIQTLKHISKLHESDSVESVSPNFMRYIQRVPNDPFYNSQWHYQAMNLPQAWDLTTGDAVVGEVIVAVIDTGVFLAHEDLDSQLLDDGYDFISSTASALDGNGIDDDPNDPGDSSLLGQSSWHGTHVAGTIAAESNNEQGVAGVSWGAKIMPLRVCGSTGCSSYDVMQAVSYAAGLTEGGVPANDSGTLPDQTADIINLSLGGFGSSAAEARLYQEVYDAGVIVVAAAGNEGVTTPAYPAAYQGVFSVSALDANNELAYYSNFGSSIDVAAPGGDRTVDETGDVISDGVFSALVDDSLGEESSSYGMLQGTSMAAPHVSGVFALMKAVYPDLDASELDAMLRAGMLTNDIGDSGKDSLYGYGSLDAFSAVNAANAKAGGTLPPVILPTPSWINLFAGAVTNIDIDNIGSGDPSLTEIIRSNEDTISVTPLSVNAQGLGEYNIEVSRGDLEDGVYSETITFRFDTAQDVVVPLNFVVGDVSVVGKASQLRINFFEVGEAFSKYTFIFLADSLPSVFNYSLLNEIEAGEYIVLISTDIDSDSFVCDSGEACGFYPNNARIQHLTVDSNKTGINMTVDVVSDIGSISSFPASQSEKVGFTYDKSKSIIIPLVSPSTSGVLQ